MTLQEAQQKIEQASDFQTSELEGDRITQARSNYARLYHKRLKRSRIS